MTTDLERRLRALRDELPEPPGGIDPAAVVTASEVSDVVVLPSRSPRRRTRWVVAALVAAVLVAGVVVAVEVVRGGSTTDRRDAVSEVSTARVDPATQVVHDGDRVEGTGKIVAIDGQPVRFCAPAAEAFTGGQEEQAARYCPQSLTVTGVDLGALAGRVTFPGVVSGYAHLTATLHGGSLTDVSQAPPPDDTPYDDVVPCAAPAGGWPVGPALANIDVDPIAAYRAAHPGAIVTFGALRPSATQVVPYVLTSSDPAPVEAALRAAYGPTLCVVRSDYTQAEIDEASAAFDPSKPLWKALTPLSVGSGGFGPDAQPVVLVGITRVTDAVVSAVRGLTPGLVQFDPWLSPVA